MASDNLETASPNKHLPSYSYPSNDYFQFDELTQVQVRIAGSIKSCLELTADPPTVIQGAVPHIMENTPESFFSDINKILKEASDLFHERLKEILPFVTCPHKPEGSMFAMVTICDEVTEGQ
ncbi:tyrosine/nicotianamine aminotransferase, pyridoxal phosphate-dependent transferase [Tanacetum coccineum]|uniref:Tyrosine/nicotianamine aminotransferase, pyridoxal phosphate-dependent transferase n=1 Tax=Tanacetum coccineum TaxID=301880 RepID=A0ABQ5GKE6_9ASTR